MKMRKEKERANQWQVFIKAFFKYFLSNFWVIFGYFSSTFQVLFGYFSSTFNGRFGWNYVKKETRWSQQKHINQAKMGSCSTAEKSVSLIIWKKIHSSLVQILLILTFYMLYSRCFLVRNILEPKGQAPHHRIRNCLVIYIWMTS